ncbi:hypothetical protein GGI12_003099 [Dipsacomyces acuminosporus]|nr:hypothetical protein GGI12_003099 [Dipsacomyces acuminosporus]
MAVVYERKYKSVLKTTAQILSKGVPIWEYKAGPSIPSISLVRLSDSISSEPPAYAEVSGQSEIKLHSHTIQPLIYNFAYEDSTGYEWQLRWMRKEDYDDRDYSFATTAWNELVCVDCSTLRIVARIRKKLSKSKVAGHLFVSNSLMPDFQDMLLITAILVFDSFPNDGDLTHYI